MKNLLIIEIVTFSSQLKSIQGSEVPITLASHLNDPDRSVIAISSRQIFTIWGVIILLFFNLKEKIGIIVL